MIREVSLLDDVTRIGAPITLALHGRNHASSRARTVAHSSLCDGGLRSLIVLLAAIRR